MNIKRFFLAVLVFFIAFQAIDYVIHSIILIDTYESLQHLWRTDMSNYMWVYYVSSVLLAFLFVYIFTRGYQGRGWMEGLRYGILVGLLMQGVGMLNQFFVYPIPGGLLVQWIIYGLVNYIICGILVALIYKPKD